MSYHDLRVALDGLAGPAEAVQRWFDTTHGNELGHDHHCLAGRKADMPCNCGWAAARAMLNGPLDLAIRTANLALRDNPPVPVVFGCETEGCERQQGHDGDHGQLKDLPYE